MRCRKAFSKIFTAFGTLQLIQIKPFPLTEAGHISISWRFVPMGVGVLEACDEGGSIFSKISPWLQWDRCTWPWSGGVKWKKQDLLTFVQQEGGCWKGWSPSCWGGGVLGCSPLKNVLEFWSANTKMHRLESWKLIHLKILVQNNKLENSWNS